MKDPLFGNKIAAAILATLLLAFGLPIILTTFNKLVSGHHGEAHAEEGNPFGLAYTPAEIKLGGGGGGEPAPEVSLAELLQNASAARGERAAGLCKACHTLEEGGANGIGPNLWGVVGRDVASVSGFGYSGALQALEGSWDYDMLSQYLENSQAYVPGTQMAQMIRKDDKRADVLAFLQTLSDNPVPFPEPPPAEEGEAETDGEE